MTGENYFDIFGFSLSYRIELAELEAAYERLTLEHHPDFFMTAGEAEKAHSQRMSAEVNEGYRVLRSDGRRSEYLLRLLSGEHKLDTNRLPDGFLQEMFFLQEEVDELGEETDSAAGKALKQQVEQRMSGLLEERKRLFAEAEHNGRESVLQDIQTNLNCEKYLRRLLERLG
jgi:molecular chaperone HscB